MSSFIERPRYYCSLGGALSTATALPRTIPILHTPAGCSGNIAWSQNGGGGLQVGGYCGGLNVPSSSLTERDVVFGGIPRLEEQIRNTIRIMEGDLYVLLTGCVSEIIGDDVRSAVDEFTGQGADIVVAETGGFKGNSYYGYDLLLEALLREYVEPGVERIPRRVNLLGIVPAMDVFWRGNIEGIRELLIKLGLTVNSFFTYEDSLENIKEAAAAELNIVVSDVYGTEAAAVFKALHGVPYITAPLPIGPAATGDFLRQVGKALSIDTGQLEKFIAGEEDYYYQTLDPLVECYSDLDLQRYAVVVGDANYAPAITRFLAEDLGWLPELTVCTDLLTEEQQAALEDREIALETGFKNHLVFEKDSSEVIRHLTVFIPPSGAAAMSTPLALLL